MSTIRRNRFARGTGCFTCDRCGKRTRDTHGCGTHLCGPCNDHGEAENTHNDNDHELNPDPGCPICIENGLIKANNPQEKTTMLTNQSTDSEILAHRSIDVAEAAKALGAAAPRPQVGNEPDIVEADAHAIHTAIIVAWDLGYSRGLQASTPPEATTQPAADHAAADAPWAVRPGEE